LTYSEVAKRLRLPLGFILGISYLIFARPTPLTLAVGGGIALIGVIVRAWASGHISKNERLATTGPYAHTRNPLYFGSFPTPWKATQPEEGDGFSLDLYMKHGEWKAGLTYVLVIAWLTWHRPIMDIASRLWR